MPRTETDPMGVNTTEIRVISHGANNIYVSAKKVDWALEESKSSFAIEPEGVNQIS